jgi:putative endonuclease
MYHVYIIQSKKDDSWYYGFSENPKKRLNFHNNGKSSYTKGKLPWELIFCRKFELKSEALKFERYLKKTKNKKYIKRAYSDHFI